MRDMENYNELCCGANVNICAGVLLGIALDFSDSGSGSDGFERPYVAFDTVSQNDRCMSRGMTPSTRPAARRTARMGRRRCACGSWCEVASLVASMMSMAEGQSSDGDEKET